MGGKWSTGFIKIFVLAYMQIFYQLLEWTYLCLGVYLCLCKSDFQKIKVFRYYKLYLSFNSFLTRTGLLSSMPGLNEIPSVTDSTNPIAEIPIFPPGS